MFKQQNPGKVGGGGEEGGAWGAVTCSTSLCPPQFCLLVCSLCTFLAVVGRYIPGVVISYILGETPPSGPELTFDL